MSENLRTLYQKWINKTITPEEMHVLVELISEKEGEEELHSLMKEIWQELKKTEPAVPIYTEKKVRNILSQFPANPSQQHNTAGLKYAVKYVGWAAAVILFIAALYQLNLWQAGNTQQETKRAKIQPLSLSNDVAPGKEGAVLTLANGKKIQLDSINNGVIANENGVDLIFKNGQLVYNTSGDSNENIAFNTLSTPRGRQFQLVLPDKTKVWLNAGSSIKYPVVFYGNERRVEITGEVFFDVTTNRQMPFRVITNQLNAEVLGTQFNINAYQEEQSIKTTLIEGSLKISDGYGQALLKPGQEGRIKRSGTGVTILNNADTEKATAWKNGVFDFNNASLSEVMRQISRWYDIEVVYENRVPAIKFGGKMDKNLSLSQVLKALTVMGVKLKLKDKILYME